MKFVQRLNKTISNSEDIVIVGDYDADGILSSSVSNHALQLFNKDYYDKHVQVFHPSRKISYGFSIKAFEKLHEEMKFNSNKVLFLLSDNGINTFEIFEYLNKQNLSQDSDVTYDILVTDHHQQQQTYHDFLKKQNSDFNFSHLTIDPIIVDPNSENDGYPFKGLSGTGIIYKMMLLYAEEYTSQTIVKKIEELQDLVGLSAVTDIMPVIDENRYYICQALSMMNNPSENQYYWKILKKELKIDEFSYADFGWVIGPMLNAPSRTIGDSKPAFMIFNSNKRDTKKYIQKLVGLNTDRKTNSNLLLQTAIKQVESNNEFKHSVTTILPTTSGMLGLVASKLVNSRHVPSVIFTFNYNGTELLGSSRSYGEFNLVKAFKILNKKYPKMFVSFGGHSAAAGVSIHSNYYEKFIVEFDKLCLQCENRVKSEGNFHKQNYDFDYNDELFDSMQEVIENLEPFGNMFEEPMYRLNLSNTKKDITKIEFMGKDKQHIKFILDSGLQIIVWYGAYNLKPLKLRHNNYNIVFYGKPEINEFMGKKNKQFIVDNYEILEQVRKVV